MSKGFLNKAFSVFVSMVLVVSLCPLPAFAGDDGDALMAASPITSSNDGESIIGGASADDATVPDVTSVSVPDEDKAALFAQELEVVASGECGTNGDRVTWTLDSAGTLTVSGAGEMADGRIAADYADQVTAIVIEEGVRSVGSGAFQSMRFAANVSFPEGLQRIGGEAFRNCSSIARIDLPSTLTDLGGSVFAQCGYLQSISFPDSLETVPMSACYQCTKLTSVHLPANAKEISNNAFCSATSLRSLILPTGLESIGNGAFENCPLSGVISFPNTLRSIGSSAFRGNYLTSIVVPGSVKTIGGSAFYRSNNATSIVLSEGVEQIGSEAFAGSKMASLAIPSTVTNIGSKPFDGCSSLSIVTVAQDNDTYIMKGAGLYTKDGTTLIACLPAAQGAFVIAEGTTTVADGCFDTCTHITSISIPASLVAGNDNALLIRGESSFSGWKALASYEVAEENEAYQAIDGVLFNKEGTILVGFPAGAVNSANYHDGSVCSYTIPNGVKKIGDYAFYGCKLRDIVIPLSVTEIGTSALYVRDTGNGACARYAGTEAQWQGIPKRYYLGHGQSLSVEYDTVAFGLMENWVAYSLDSAGTLKLFYRSGPGVYREIPDFEEGGAPWASWADHVKEASFSDYITGVGANAFSSFTALEQVDLPASVQSVGAGAFSGCGSLRKVVCKGNPFEVEAALADSPSFPRTVRLVYYPGLGTWQGDEAFDSDAGTWNGYHVEAAGLPEIASIELSQPVVYAQGNASGWYTTSVGVVVRSTEGEDITDCVSVAVAHSEGFDYRRHPATDNGADLVYHGVDYDALAHAVTVGRNAYADTYTVIASSDGLYACGDAVNATLIVSRPAEFLAGVTSWTSPKITNQTGQGLVQLVRFENQFSEEYKGTDKIFSASVASPYRDITSELEQYGIYRIGNQVYGSQRTPSGKYTFGLHSANGAGASGQVNLTNTVVWHTATFKAGDQVVDTVRFAEGAASLDEPVVPERENYNGAWEAYDLSAARGDITVSAVYTPIDTGAVSEVDVSAEESDNGDGTKTIVLSATARTQTVRVEKTNAKPLDVVLVLDQSSSMADTLSASDARSKRDALVECAGDFLDKLYENAQATGADHRVALVGFAYSAYNGGAYRNTGLLATAAGGAKGYADLTAADYSGALLPIAVGGAFNPAVSAGVDRVVADGATAADLGLKIARNIFSTQGDAGERERIVVFITDGTPTCWGETPQLIERTAAAAISEAGYIKQSQGAKVYAVGVHAEADPAAGFNNTANGIVTNRLGGFESYDFNRFMHAVSSNYPGASSMASLGDGGKDAGYYLGVTDTSTLSNIFRDILYTTVYETKVFDRATITCKLARGVELEWGQERAICEGLGLAAGDVTVTRNADGTCDIVMRNVPVQLSDDGTGALVYQARLSFQVTVEGQAAVAEVRATVSDRSEVGGEASYSDAHEHAFAEVSRTGTCEGGVTAHYACSCGAEKDELAIAPGEAHDYVAALTSDGGLSTSVERLVCSKCGHVVEKNINYQVTYSKSFRTTVLDLSLLENEVVIQPNGSIEMRFFVGDASGRTYTVTRIAADGTKTVYRSRLENGWLVFDADHFSVYVLSEVDESGSLPTEDITYAQAMEALAGNEVDLAVSVLEPALPPSSANLSGATITLPSSAYVYDGKAKTPTPMVKLGSKTLKAGTDYTVSYSNNVKPGLATVTVTGKGNYSGSAKATFSIAAASAPSTSSTPPTPSVPAASEPEPEPMAAYSLYRLFQPKTGEHHYTLSAEERDICTDRWGWVYEGVAWDCPETSSTPVYRLFHPTMGLHHYTTSAEERDICLTRWGWQDEGLAWYADDDESGAPVYRLFHPVTAHHHYTTSWDEVGICTDQWGWTYEGVAWYARE